VVAFGYQRLRREDAVVIVGKKGNLMPSNHRILNPFLHSLHYPKPQRLRSYVLKPLFLNTFIASGLLLNPAEASEPAQLQFFQQLKAYCGQAFAGTLSKSEASDQDMLGKSLVMHVRECNDTELKVPFHVGDDHSRTWVISQTTTGLRLKHDHRHQDGSADVVTQYGGDTAVAGTAFRQEFVVDDDSKTMFSANGRSVSNTNVWYVEIIPGKVYRYGLKRPGRQFEVEFDLTKAVALPPVPWGH
jgi:hypothetical protein